MAKVNKRSSFKIWQDVIFALFVREIRAKFNDKLGLGWAILQPVISVSYTHLTLPTIYSV